MPQAQNSSKGGGAVRRTNLRGHALRGEGAAFVRGDEERETWLRCSGHIGRGLCECGAVSAVEWSNAARKRWHAAHKDGKRARSMVKEDAL